MPDIVDFCSQRVATDLKRASLSGGSHATQSSRTLLRLAKKALTTERDKSTSTRGIALYQRMQAASLTLSESRRYTFARLSERTSDWNSSRSISFCNDARKWQISSRRDAIPPLINSTGPTRRKVYPQNTNRKPPMN